MQSPIRIGLIGCGVVGSGVVEVLRENAASIAQRVGQPVEIARVADRSGANAKRLKLPKNVVTTDGMAIATDPSIDIVVELIGGVTVAGDLIEAALRSGKHVVTANKALLAEKGAKLFALAEKNERGLFFEAAVGGAIPIIRAVKGGLAGDRIERVYGILNGTCNYILTKMAEEGWEFTDALKEAQTLGFAEADPTLDVEGGDTAHKLALLAMLAFGTTVRYADIATTGITRLAAADFAFARRLGRVIKLLAVGKRSADGLELRVAPVLLPRESPLAMTRGSTNMIVVHAAAAGELVFSGRGAGSRPTASAVVGDIVHAAQSIAIGQLLRSSRGMHSQKLASLPILPIECTTSSVYLRLTVADELGTIHTISGVLARHGLSIRDLLQLESHKAGEAMPLAMILHPASDAVIARAIRDLDRLKCVAAKTVVLRVED